MEYNGNSGNMFLSTQINDENLCCDLCQQNFVGLKTIGCHHYVYEHQTGICKLYNDMRSVQTLLAVGKTYGRSLYKVKIFNDEKTTINNDYLTSSEGKSLSTYGYNTQSTRVSRNFEVSSTSIFTTNPASYQKLESTKTSIFTSRPASFQSFLPTSTSIFTASPASSPNSEPDSTTLFTTHSHVSYQKLETPTTPLLTSNLATSHNDVPISTSTITSSPTHIPSSTLISSVANSQTNPQNFESTMTSMFTSSPATSKSSEPSSTSMFTNSQMRFQNFESATSGSYPSSSPTSSKTFQITAIFTKSPSSVLKFEPTEQSISTSSPVNSFTSNGDFQTTSMAIFTTTPASSQNFESMSVSMLPPSSQSQVSYQKFEPPTTSIFTGNLASSQKDVSISTPTSTSSSTGTPSLTSMSILTNSQTNPQNFESTIPSMFTSSKVSSKNVEPSSISMVTNSQTKFQNFEPTYTSYLSSSPTSSKTFETISTSIFTSSLSSFQNFEPTTQAIITSSLVNSPTSNRRFQTTSTSIFTTHPASSQKSDSTSISIFPSSQESYKKLEQPTISIFTSNTATSQKNVPILNSIFTSSPTGRLSKSFPPTLNSVSIINPHSSEPTSFFSSSLMGSENSERATTTSFFTSSQTSYQSNTPKKMSLPTTNQNQMSNWKQSSTDFTNDRFSSQKFQPSALIFTSKQFNFKNFQPTSTSLFMKTNTRPRISKPSTGHTKTSTLITSTREHFPISQKPWSNLKNASTSLLSTKKLLTRLTNFKTKSLALTPFPSFSKSFSTGLKTTSLFAKHHRSTSLESSKKANSNIKTASFHELLSDATRSVITSKTNKKIMKNQYTLTGSTRPSLMTQNFLTSLKNPRYDVTTTLNTPQNILTQKNLETFPNDITTSIKKQSFSKRQQNFDKVSSDATKITNPYSKNFKKLTNFVKITTPNFINLNSLSTHVNEGSRPIKSTHTAVTTKNSGTSQRIPTLLTHLTLPSITLKSKKSSRPQNYQATDEAKAILQVSSYENGITAAKNYDNFQTTKLKYLDTAGKKYWYDTSFHGSLLTKDFTSLFQFTTPVLYPKLRSKSRINDETISTVKSPELLLPVQVTKGSFYILF